MNGGTGRALIVQQSSLQLKQGHQLKTVCYLCGDPGHFCRDCPRNQQKMFVIVSDLQSQLVNNPTPDMACFLIYKNIKKFQKDNT